MSLRWMILYDLYCHLLNLGYDSYYYPICRNNKEFVKQLNIPPPGSRDLHFPTRFSQNGWEQVKSCLWKQHLAYWRNPAYNLIRITHSLASALIFGTLYWNQGKKLWVFIFFKSTFFFSCRKMYITWEITSLLYLV